MTTMLTLHVLPPSHPCRTAEATLRHKGLDFERVALQDLGRRLPCVPAPAG